MVQTLNFISLSSQQAPNDVDWPGLVKAGVQGALIRLGHGIIRDPCASGHIAKAKQYGLYWHGYHTYEGVVNEPQFTIKNATDLGLSNSQYYFVDLAKSSDPFNDYYALHATWLSQGYSTGLLISNDDYLSKFKDSEVIASGTLRWLISDTEPANYDVWQYSSEGTVGISSVKVGFNFSKTDKLKYNLDTTLTGADINKDPYNPETPVGGAYIGWGYDTTGLGGGKTIGYSTDGKNFYALIGPDGLIVRKNDGNRIYGTIADQIDSAISANVIPAKSAADSAVSAADAAVASAQVTSDAVTAIASATAEAKQDANEAMSRAESAWDVATGAKEAVTDFDPLVKSAQSDAKQANETAMSAYEQSRSAYDAVQADSSAVVAMQSSMADFREDVASTQSVADGAKADAGKALTQIADTANALSDAKTAFNSGVAEAKQLASTAQTTADSAVESAGENAKALTSQANALSDVKKAMDSGVASATGLANAAQTTANNAIKSASSVANDLAAVASQAKSNASGITKVTSDVGLLQTTVADNSGNISKIQETAAQIQQAVSDNSGAIVVAKQTADSAVAVASDARSNATVASQTASQASITASNASGQAASAVLTANGAMTTASNAKSDATVAVQTASGASLVATNAQSDATIAKQTASEATVQASNAESDFAQLSIRANKIEANVATNSGAIASVQQTANGFTTMVGKVDGRVKTIEDKTNWITKTGSLDMNTLTTTQNIYYRDSNLQNADGESGWAYIQVVSVGERVTQTVWHDRSSIQHTRTGAVSGSSYNWDAWNKTATYDQVAEVKQTVDGLSTLVSDPKAGMTATYQTASQASLTAQNASGQAVTAVTTAKGAVTTANNAQSDAVVAKQTASEASVTASNAAGDASVAKQTASQASISVQNAQSDITSLGARADSLEAFQKEASGNINKLVSRADGVDQTLTNQAGDITTLQSRAGKLESSMSTANGQISTLQQTANGLTTTVADIKANGGGRNLWINSKSFQNTNVNAPNVDWDIDSDGITTAHITGNGGFYGKWQYIYANNTDPFAIGDSETFSVEMKGTGTITIGRENDFEKAVTLTNAWTRYSVSGEFKGANRAHIIYNESGKDCDAYVRLPMVEKGTVAHDWSPAPDDLQNQFTQIKQSIDGVTTTINDPKTGLNATYQTAAGNATTISNVKGDVAQLQTTASGLTSRVGNLESKTNTQQTAIDQNKAAIALKADQTDVDKINGTVNQLQSSLTVQAGQIQEKVTSSQVAGMLTGYATQTYTQSLVTQKANDWNLNLTNLKTDVDAIKTTGGGVNLANGTSSEDQSYGDASKTTGWFVITIANFDDPQAGQQYTISVNVKPNGGSYYMQIWDGTSPTQRANNVYSGDINVTQEQKLTATITWPSGSNKYLLVQLVNHNNGGQIVWNSAMIEEGTVAHTWSPAPSDMATVTSVANLSATVDGIQSQVYNSDGSSKITQLSNLIVTKVSQGDYNSQITQLKNDINLRVAKGDLISQINQEAGGNTLIQVSNGKGSLILDADNTIVTGKAWIPSAAIAELDADKLTFYGNGAKASIGASIAQYDDDKTKSTINLQYDGGIEIHSSSQQGSILTMHDKTIRLASKSWGDNPNAYQYSGFYAAPNYSLMNTYHRDGTTSGVAIDDDRIHIYGSSKDNQLGALQADIGWYSINGKTGLLTGNQISLKAGNTQAVLTDNNININNASDNNDKNYDVAIHVKGWAEMTGWFTCMGITQTSLLSTKTRIEPLDTKVALDKIASTNVETYQFKSDVAKGKAKRHASVIIDDVNEVAEYYTPEEFISENRMGRDDGDIIGYLMGAVQELKKQLDELKEKI